jgi:8-oxo-dGTP diphosphatase
MARAVSVVAGIISHGGRVLIGQRKTRDWHGGKWEFPGGKIEVGEAAVEALARELREELGIEARIGTELQRYEFHYDTRPPVELIFFEVRQFSGVPVNYEFEQILWEWSENLPNYDFLDGDKDIIRWLAESKYR